MNSLKLVGPVRFELTVACALSQIWSPGSPPKCSGILDQTKLRGMVSLVT